MVTSDKLGSYWVREAIQSFYLSFQCYNSPFGGPMGSCVFGGGELWQIQVLCRVCVCVCGLKLNIQWSKFWHKPGTHVFMLAWIWHQIVSEFLAFTGKLQYLAASCCCYFQIIYQLKIAFSSSQAWLCQSCFPKLASFQSQTQNSCHTRRVWASGFFMISARQINQRSNNHKVHRALAAVSPTFVFGRVQRWIGYGRLLG